MKSQALHKINYIFQRKNTIFSIAFTKRNTPVHLLLDWVLPVGPAPKKKNYQRYIRT